MLGKLIKYDFKALAKTLFPIYAVMIVLTFVCSLMAKFRLTEGFLFLVFAILLGMLLGSSFAITGFFVVLRFYNGLLKNEGYLSFALPVKTSTHILAKVLNALIWSLIETVAVAVCILIMGLFAASFKDIANAFSLLFKLDANFYLSISQILLLTGLELVCMTCLMFVALCIAHLFEKHQKLIAALFVIVMMLMRSLIFPTRLFYEFGEKELLFIAPQWYLIPLLCSGVYALVTWYILDKKLNLE